MRWFGGSLWPSSAPGTPREAGEEAGAGPVLKAEGRNERRAPAGHAIEDDRGRSSRLLIFGVFVSRALFPLSSSLATTASSASPAPHCPPRSQRLPARARLPLRLLSRGWSHGNVAIDSPGSRSGAGAGAGAGAGPGEGPGVLSASIRLGTPMPARPSPATQNI